MVKISLKKKIQKKTPKKIKKIKKNEIKKEKKIIKYLNQLNILNWGSGGFAPDKSKRIECGRVMGKIGGDEGVI